MEKKQAPLDAPKVIRIGRVQLTLNVFVQAVVVLAIVAMANYLSIRHYRRFDLSQNQKFALSPQTKAIVGGLAKPLQAIVFFAGAAEGDADANIRGEAEANCRQLLREYEFASRGKMTVEEVSPYQNLTRARELQIKYKFGANESIVILDYEGKSKFINTSRMVELEKLDEVAKLMRHLPQIKGFKGEQLITSALLELTEEKQSKVYLIAGHGEYEFNAPENLIFEEQLKRQNIKAESLTLANLGKIPDDANALIILGPHYDYSERDLKLLSEYWDRKGRVFIALAPVGKKTGLDGWIAARGVLPMNDKVLGLYGLGEGLVGIADPEAIVLPQSGSPITKTLDGVTFALIGQTQSFALNRTKETTDQLSLISLVTAPKDFWGETEYTADRKSAPYFDPKKDNAAPLTLAASVEKSASRDPNVKLDTARLVVIGNGDFLSVEGYKAAGDKGLFFATNALNWLLSRDNLIAIPSKEKKTSQIALNEGKFFAIAKWVSLYIPGLVGLFGLCYLWARHGKSVLKLTASIAFSFVFCWALWRSLLWYLGNAEGRRLSSESLIALGAAVLVGTVALVLLSRKKTQPQQS